MNEKTPEELADLKRRAHEIMERKMLEAAMRSPAPRGIYDAIYYEAMETLDSDEGEDVVVFVGRGDVTVEGTQPLKCKTERSQEDLERAVCEMLARNERLEADLIDSLSPGIRETVTFMRRLGFETTDSGDGSNHAAGMECALDFPHVFAVIPRHQSPIHEAHRLMDALRDAGLHMGPSAGPDAPQVQLTYDPYDFSAVLALFNVNDAVLRGERLSWRQ